MSDRALLDVRHLRKTFPIRRGFARKVVGEVRAVDDVSFTIDEGETLGLVGESGCGKTTTARCILRAMRPTSGEILFRAADGRVVDLAPLSRAELRPLRPQIQMVFQDPFGSLNPRMTIFDRPRHPYTAALMRAVPIPDPHAASGDVALAGEVANPAAPPSGCYFHPRCPFTIDTCRREPPALREVAGGHLVRCHRAEELTLKGVS